MDSVYVSGGLLIYIYFTYIHVLLIEDIVGM